MLKDLFAKRRTRFVSLIILMLVSAWLDQSISVQAQNYQIQNNNTPKNGENSKPVEDIHIFSVPPSVAGSSIPHMNEKIPNPNPEIRLPPSRKATNLKSSSWRITAGNLSSEPLAANHMSATFRASQKSVIEALIAECRNYDIVEMDIASASNQLLIVLQPGSRHGWQPSQKIRLIASALPVSSNNTTPSSNLHLKLFTDKLAESNKLVQNVLYRIRLRLEQSTTL